MKQKEGEEKDSHPVFRAKLTLGERIADKFTVFCGSWAFIFTITIIIIVWIVANILMVFYKWDPYPFILLNLVLACLTAIEAPIILMSQNREAQRNRIRTKYDYDINRKAEREIRIVQNKIDELKKSIEKIERKL